VLVVRWLAISVALRVIGLAPEVNNCLCPQTPGANNTGVTSTAWRVGYLGLSLVSRSTKQFSRFSITSNFTVHVCT
jgi:hypothetical protein